MQLSSKKNTLLDLSILVRKDGFSFCTKEQHHFFGFETTPPTEESVKSFINYHQLQPKNIHLVYLDSPSVSVPRLLFDEQQLDNYLKTALQKEEKTGAHKNELQSLDQVVVYPVNETWNKLFKLLFPTVKEYHLSAYLLPDLAKYAFGKAKKNMFVHLRKDYFDLFLFQGGQLLVQNSFPQKNPDEFMYYLFYVCEQFYLKPKDFDLLFLGQFLAFSEHYNGTKEFHPNLTYLAPTFPSVDPHHPAPFLQSYFPEWESSQERLKGVA